MVVALLAVAAVTSAIAAVGYTIAAVGYTIAAVALPVAAGAVSVASVTMSIASVALAVAVAFGVTTVSSEGTVGADHPVAASMFTTSALLATLLGRPHSEMD